MDRSSANRRAVLQLGTGAFILGVGATAVTTTGFAVSQAQAAAFDSVSPQLAKLIEAHRSADETLNRWYDTTWNPAVDAQQTAVEAIPHVEASAPAYRNVLAGECAPRTFTTANKTDVSECRAIVSIPRDRQSKDPKWQEKYRAARRLVAADKWRQRQIAQLSRPVDALRAQEDALWVPISAAAKAITSFPPASLADLAAKLEWFRRDGGDDADYLMPIIIADVAQLRGRG